MPLKSITTLLIFLIAIPPGNAQNQKKLPKHHEDHYHLSVFIGYSTDMDKKTGYKLGIEYEYRLNKKLGVGGTFDFILIFSSHTD